MGVNKLWKTISKDGDKFKSFRVKEKTFSNYNDLKSIGNWFALDCSIWMIENVKFKKFSSQTQSLEKPETPIWLRNMISRLKELLVNEIRVIAVIESETCSANKHSEGFKSYGKQFKSMLNQLKAKLNELGVPLIQATDDTEAEAVCAYLEVSNVVAGVITNDSDVLLYGSKNVIKNLKIESTKHKITGSFTILTAKTGYNVVNELLTFAIISGCDFCKGLKGKGSSFFFTLINSSLNNDEYQSYCKTDEVIKFRERILNNVSNLEKKFLVYDFSMLKLYKKPKVNSFDKTSIIFKIYSERGKQRKEVFFEKILKRRVLYKNIVFDCLVKVKEVEFVVRLKEKFVKNEFPKEFENFMRVKRKKESTRMRFVSPKAYKYQKELNKLERTIEKLESLSFLSFMEKKIEADKEKKEIEVLDLTQALKKIEVTPKSKKIRKVIDLTLS